MPSLPEDVCGTEEIVEGRPFTREEQATWDAGQESLKRTVPNLNDALGRLITLNTALIGGGMIVAKGEVIPFEFGVVVLALFFASLLVAMSGLWPRKRLLRMDYLHEVERFRNEVLARKDTCMKVAGILFIIAIAASLTGLVVKGPLHQ